MANIPKRPCPIPVARAIIRPTGLLDPEIILKPVANQVDDILEQARQRISKNQRVLITTLTKKFAEELDEYFKKINLKSAYVHSDIDTLERLDIIADLRQGKYDILIGINLLREGLDLPEVSLVAIFDADKEGFLRSKTSLIQIIGRAARHTEGTVIMYADRITDSMRYAIEETARRRALQLAYNQQHGIIPRSVERKLTNLIDKIYEETDAVSKTNPVQWTPFGFDQVPTAADLVDLPIENRFATRPNRRSQQRSKSGQIRSTKQIYQDFETLKTHHLALLEKQNLELSQLRQRLQIAIDAMDFEMAAALRDLIRQRENETSRANETSK